MIFLFCNDLLPWSCHMNPVACLFWKFVIITRFPIKFYGNLPNLVLLVLSEQKLWRPKIWWAESTPRGIGSVFWLLYTKVRTQTSWQHDQVLQIEQASSVLCTTPVTSVITQMSWKSKRQVQTKNCNLLKLGIKKEWIPKFIQHWPLGSPTFKNQRFKSQEAEFIE